MYYINFQDFTLAALIFARLTAMIAVLPVFGHRAVPWPYKAGLSVFLSLIIFPFAQLGFTPHAMNFAEFVIAVSREVVTGLLLGFVAMIIFYGFQMAGQVIGIQIGFGIINVLDPMTDIQVSLLEQVYFITILMVFLAIDGHHFLIRTIVLSFEKIPVGGALFPPGLMSKVNVMGGAVFDIGLRVSAPVMVSLFITDVALGFMARVAPQMNVFIVGFPLKIGLGLLVIMLTISYFPYIFEKFFINFQTDLVEIVRLLGQ